MSVRFLKSLVFGLTLSLCCGQTAVFAQALAPAPANGPPAMLLPGMPQSGTPIGAPAKGCAPGFVMPSMGSYNLPIPAGMRPVPSFVPGQNGLQAYMSKRMNPGTVLTGHLEDDLASNKNKAGDIFSIRLEEGFTDANGNELIPRQSKIVGIVTRATGARSQHNGMPGMLDVSLQKLVFPDGSSIQFYGMIDHNPAMDHKFNGSPSIMSGPVGSLRTGALSIFTALNSKVGLPLRTPKAVGGLDFQLDKGELLPVKLNRPLDLKNMTPAPPGLVAATGMPGALGAPNAVPGFGNTAAPSTVGIGQHVTPPNPVPDWAGNAPLAPSFRAPAPLPVPERATAGLLPGISAAHPSAADMPDPF